ncbi:ABC transporter substrate-binding protein [Pseudonocardia lacus]|uniref:ABC transporter substrate-binding protein n=1 Tax=Pseudonocardia lacus TaxID=2835865 RepID=UPI001BDD8869|nr:ABC transporter substrate-binding protein [Pseudonocardia lacus]
MLLQTPFDDGNNVSTARFKLVIKCTSLIAVACLVLAGCGAGGDTDPGAEQGGTLAVGSLDTPLNLDPATGRAGTEYSYLKAIYDTLISYDPATLLPAPGLAESYEFRGPDQLEFVMKLRQGVKFQDGTTLDAAAVKASLEYYKGAGVRKDLDPVTAITVEDPSTVVLTLKSAYSTLPALLADRAGMIISPAAIEKFGDTIADNPVGAGAYGVKSWTKKVSLEFAANQEYWRGEPGYDTIDVRFFEDEGAMISALTSGQVQYAYPVSAEQLPVIEAMPNLDVTTQQTLAFRFLRVNQDKPPLDDKRVRQALNLAIDRQSLGKAALGDLDVVEATVPVPPDYYAYGTGTYGYPHDPARAKELLAEAGHAGGLSIQVCPSSSTPENLKEIQILSEQVARVGITLDVTQVPGQGCIDQFYKGDWSLMLTGHTGRVDPWFTYSEAWSGGGANNMNGGRPISPVIDERLTEILSISDAEQQKAKYTEINEAFLEEAPMVGLYFSPTITVKDARVDGQVIDLQGKVILAGLKPAAAKAP